MGFVFVIIKRVRVFGEVRISMISTPQLFEVNGLFDATICKEMTTCNAVFIGA